MSARRATGRARTAAQRAEQKEAEEDAKAAEPTEARLTAIAREGKQRHQNRVAWWVRELDHEPGIYSISGNEETEKLISRGFAAAGVEELAQGRIHPDILNHRPRQYKIGMSQNLKARLGAYRCTCFPLGFRVWGLIRFDKARLIRYYRWKNLRPAMWRGEERKMRTSIKKLFAATEHLERRLFQTIAAQRWAVARRETGVTEFFDFGEQGYNGMHQALQNFTNTVQEEWQEQFNEPGNNFATFQDQIRWITVDDDIMDNGGGDDDDPGPAPDGPILPPQPDELAMLRRELRSGGQREHQDQLVAHIAGQLRSRELDRLLDRQGFRS